LLLLFVRYLYLILKQTWDTYMTKNFLSLP